MPAPAAPAGIGPDQLGVTIVGTPATLLRFGSFELDPKCGELRKHGEHVHLPPQPFKVLLLLARRSGDVVTRNEIREQIWSDATFVDFDQGLNFCVRQIREALGDDAGAPQYIETLPRRGYRFLLPVDAPDPSPAPTSATRMIVLPFRMPRPDPEIEFLAFSLPDAMTNSLSGLESLVMRSSLVASRFAGVPVDPKAIAADADVDVVLSGSLLRSGEQLRLSTQLTEVPAGTLLWSRTWQVSLGDLFRVQDELTSRVVESLALPLTAREHGLLKRDIPRSPTAYECYLRGNQLSQDPKQWNGALALFRRVVEGGFFCFPAMQRTALAGERQRDLKARAPFGRGAGHDASVVKDDDLLDEGEAKAGAVPLRREERAEHAVARIGGNARAVVVDGNP
jgi:DNA-binding winged helix-turn-helix (wHTH) protein